MYEYGEILSRMLALIPDTLDKRPSSPIYDALAPCAAELAQAYIALEIWQEQTYLLTAFGENLDMRAGDFALTRHSASAAILTVQTTDVNGEPFNAPVGSAFAAQNTLEPITYTLTEYTATGTGTLICDMPGAIGNAYTGALLPLQIINNLGSAVIVGVPIPGEDEETDEIFRARILGRLAQKSFGGNVADYKNWVLAMPGAGAVKVFPVWDGGGSVLLSVIDGEYHPISPEFVAQIKEAIDPEASTGLGIGLAPIGHTVTVATPQIVAINVTATVALSGASITQVQQNVEQSILDYFYTIGAAWADQTGSTVYVSRIIEAILRVPNVVNVSGVTLNGAAAADVVLQDTAAAQYLPVLGEVSLSE